MKMNIRKYLGLAAVAGLLAIVAPAASQAVSLVNPGTAVTAQQTADGLTTEVRWGRHRGWGHRRAWGRHHGWRRHHWRRHRW